MTTYEALLSEYGDKLNIEERSMLHDGLYCDNVVWINRNLPTSRKACILAEEIGHYTTSVGDILDIRDLDNARQELRARVWAFNKLLSVDQIVDAASKGYTEVYEMAEYLGVDEKFLRDYLVYQGMLDISI